MKLAAEVKDFSSEMLAEELVKLNEKLGIPVSLKEVGVKEELFEAMAIDAMKSGNITVNPRMTEIEDVIHLYEQAF